MSAWNKEELTRMGRAEEIDIAVRQPDGGLRNRVRQRTRWGVVQGRAGDLQRSRLGRRRREGRHVRGREARPRG